MDGTPTKLNSSAAGVRRAEICLPEVPRWIRLHRWLRIPAIIAGAMSLAVGVLNLSIGGASLLAFGLERKYVTMLLEGVPISLVGIVLSAYAIRRTAPMDIWRKIRRASRGQVPSDGFIQRADRHVPPYQVAAVSVILAILTVMFATLLLE